MLSLSHVRTQALGAQGASRPDALTDNTPPHQVYAPPFQAYPPPPQGFQGYSMHPQVQGYAQPFHSMPPQGFQGYPQQPQGFQGY